jgi:TPR repeat protein
MKVMNKMQGTVKVAAVALTLAAGCVVGPRGRVFFIPPPFPIVPPPPRVFVPPPPVFVPPPVVFAPLPSSLMQRAEAGDPVAQFTLGSCYANGRGVPRDYQQAVQWYYRSAVQGYAPAQNRLGVCYYRGLGTPRNFASAVVWYRKAADQGNAVAQDNLGSCYYNGHGVRRDYAEAARWYGLSAAQGNQTAATHLRQTQNLPGAAPAANPPPSQAQPTTPAPAEPVEPSSENQITVDEIKSLNSAGVKADAITGEIKSTNSKFSQQDIAAAQQANVDPAVIDCMKENQR